MNNKDLNRILELTGQEALSEAKNYRNDPNYGDYKYHQDKDT